jgi:FkbM family methyltransferase
VADCLGFRRNGFFLDFGAFDGQTISNTYVLEKELGWNGLCVEPNPRFFGNLQQCRSCITVNVALWPKSLESIRFVDAHGLSTIESYKDSDANAERRSQATHGIIEVQTLNPTDLLRQCHAPEQIDYLSLDVEGAEYEVLGALDLTSYAIALMTIEHNHDLPKQEKIRSHLSRFGYEVVQHCNDDFFFHREHLARLTGGSRKGTDALEAFRRISRTYCIDEPGTSLLRRMARTARRVLEHGMLGRGREKQDS